jgi:enoyl-CoA hydratase
MIDYSKYKFIKVEKKEKVAIITLNNPDEMNAIGRAEHGEVEQIWEDMNHDNEVHAVILTGAGRAFSAGGDINLMVEGFTNHSIRIPSTSVKRIIVNLINMRKPIVAAINGACAGLGATIALHCDVVLASEKARIGDPHIGVGLIPGDGGIMIWPLLVGMAKAKQYLMTGDMVAAPEAERIGLITKAVPPEQLMDEAWNWAKRFADGPQMALSFTKMLFNKILEERVNLLFDTTIAYEYHTLNSADHFDAAKSFLEKRKPNFGNLEGEQWVF